jgi:phosphoserine phosphatase RsbU/P
MVPCDRVGYINQFVHTTAPHNRFVTFFYAELDPKTGMLQYINAGHNPPFFLNANSSPQMLPKGGLPLGVQRQSSYPAVDFMLHPGQILVLYTDGISEAMNTELAEFGEQRLLESVQALANGSAQEIVDGLLQREEEFRGSAAPHDDQTLVVIKRLSFS